MTQTKHLVSVIIPSFNPRGLLAPCLESIPREGTEVIVVDNGSRDESVIQAKLRFPGIRFIFLSCNTGFAHATNQGAQAAKGNVLCFLNQDAEIIREGFELALDFLLADERRAVVTGKVVYPDGRVQETLRRFPSFFDFFFGRRSLLNRLFPANSRSMRYLYKDVDFTQPLRLEACTGMFMLVRREVFDSLGGFDEGFFFYVEDIDFCKRLAEKGWETWLVPNTVAMHHVGENLSGSRTYVKMHHYKGILRYLIKHKKARFPIKILFWLGVGVAIVFHLITSNLLKN